MKPDYLTDIKPRENADQTNDAAILAELNADPRHVRNVTATGAGDDDVDVFTLLVTEFEVLRLNRDAT